MGERLRTESGPNGVTNDSHELGSISLMLMNVSLPTRDAYMYATSMTVCSVDLIQKNWRRPWMRSGQLVSKSGSREISVIFWELRWTHWMTTEFNCRSRTQLIQYYPIFAYPLRELPPREHLHLRVNWCVKALIHLPSMVVSTTDP